ncbi:MAG: outer membrane beta-barrel protein [Bacteroidia bacterium]|nr:outer membrane beta-barrel protein [Bacteroidia bacterium]
MKKYHLLLFLLFLTSKVFSQDFRVQGVVLDESSRISLVGANVLLVSIPDSSKSIGTTTDIEGRFKMVVQESGQYKLRVSYLGSYTYTQPLGRISDDLDLGTIFLKPKSLNLTEARVEERAVRAEQKGDTTQYNANAFKTNPDASLEDLAKKMPGITMEGGTLKAHGEDVKKVLIDGKEYFGDDVTAALKNLPAEVVDKIQVFDKLSDQSQLTGFNDGNTTKTINIITKPGKSNGQFGKVFGGYGTDFTNNRYQSGVNLNLFSSKRKISIIGQSNNINVQNFSSQDLAGIFPQQQGGPGGGMGGRGMGGGGMGRPPGYQSDADNFTVSSLGGITTTHAAGINYSESWGKKLTINTSYFFNLSENGNENSLERTYFNNELQGQVYQESNSSSKENMIHRGSLRVEYNPDTLNSIIFTPKLTYQRAITTTSSNGSNSFQEATLNSTNTANHSFNEVYNFSGEILYQHKFLKKGRTFSLSANSQGNNRKGTSKLNSQNYYFESSDSTEVLLEQLGSNQSRGITVGGNIGYTEPVGKKSIVELNYIPAVTWNNADKRTYKLGMDSIQDQVLDSILSSTYGNTYAVQRVRLSYRFRTDMFNFMLGASYQYAELEGNQEFPNNQGTFRSFSNVLPMAMMMVQFSKKANWRIFYRSNTNPPSITQLQEVVDNSNPLMLTSGNPFLKQDYSHFLGSRFSWANAEKGTNFFLFGNISTTLNYVGNSTFIASSDTLLTQGVTLYRGARITKPINLNGYLNGRIFLNYGLPLTFIKCNLNFNAGFGYSQTPSLINNERNLAKSANPTAGFVLSSNINEKLDFTVSLTGNYYLVSNSLLQTQNSNYYIQNSSARLNWQFWKGFLISTELNHTLYTGLGSAFNTSFFLWNGGFAYKFLKNQNAELRLSVFDILNQNQSVSRNLSDTYIENSRNLVLNRYYMFTFTYVLRKFKSQERKNP